MDLVISEDTLQAAHMSAEELKREIAVWLFDRKRGTLVQAAHVTDMNLLAFQHLLASREMGPHYDIEDSEEDLDTLRREGRI